MSVVHVDPASALDAARDPLGAVLALCDRGRTALAEAQTITEGREVLGMLSTLEHAVKVRDLNAEAVVAASAMRVRAERRVGELLRAQPKNTGGRPRLRAVPETSPAGGEVSPHPRITDLGLSHNEASDFQRLADADDDTFEQAITDETDRAVDQRGTSVTRAGVLRRINPDREKSVDARWIEADRFIDSCKRLTQQSDAAVTAIRFGIYPGDAPLVGQAVGTAIDEARQALARVAEEWTRSQ